MPFFRKILFLCYCLVFVNPCLGQVNESMVNSVQKACGLYDGQNYISCLDSIIISNSSHRMKLEALLEKGAFYVARSMPDSALAIGNRGLLLVTEKEEKESVEFYNLIAIGQVSKGNFEAAINGYMKCTKYLESIGDSISVAVIKTNIANIYLKIRDNLNAKQLIKEAYVIFEDKLDSNNMAMSLGMLAFVNLRLLDTISAFKHAEQARTISVAIKNSRWEVRALGVLAGVYQDGGNYDSAIFFYKKTIEKAEEASMHYHIRMANVGLLNVYYLQGNYTKAAKLAQWLKPTMEKNGSVSELQKFYKVYSNVLYANNEGNGAYKYLSKAYTLYDSIAGVKNKKIVNDIRIKYETEKKDKEIAEKQLALQKQSSKLYKRTLVVILLGLLTSVLVLVIVLIRTQNKFVLRQVEEEKRVQVLKAQMAGEEKERKRIAKDLHDGIANELAVIKLTAEQLSSNAKKEEGVVELKKLASIAFSAHNEVRRISHNLYPVPILNRGLARVVKEYFEGLPVNDTVLNVQVIKKHKVLLKPEYQLLVFRLSQELVGNAIKHSNAKEIHIDLLVSEEQLTITVEDNGIGISSNVYKSPKCLSSIKENVRMLGGAVDINSEVGKGTSIMILIPNKA